MICKINTWSRVFSVCDIFSKFVHFQLRSPWLLRRIRSDRLRFMAFIFNLSILFTKALFAFARANSVIAQTNERNSTLFIGVIEIIGFREG